ncbi:hypothetical protein LWM68_23965 [Niabella sp. W65]|nr:hypothetical protein [Niabella sp. W65]MCH7365558.1 hypothetical protein [Niabella sp. W65]
MNNNTKIQELRKITSRINWMSEHKINAFSPTIAPAPKSIAHNEIESIYEGLRYYVKNGVQDIVIKKVYGLLLRYLPAQRPGRNLFCKPQWT